MKIRCSQCGKYAPRGDMYRSSPLLNVCSPECHLALYRKKSPPKQGVNERRTDGVVPPIVRAIVDVRDAHRCRYCGVSNNLHIHHILYRSQGGEHEEGNLITLCAEHHALVHSSKQRYMPLLLGVLWVHYAERKRLSVPQVERWVHGRNP